MEDKNIYIPEYYRLDERKAYEYLLELSNLGTPLALILKEIYKDKRIVFYSTEKMLEVFKKEIDNFLFYDLNICFCSDKQFSSQVGGNEIYFNQIEKIDFKKDDVFFAFDIEAKTSIVEYVKKKGICIEVFSKYFMWKLIDYALFIHPLKNFLKRNKGISVIIAKPFEIPTETNCTKWEKYLMDNKLGRTATIQKLKEGEYPFFKGIYSDKYKISDILEMQLFGSKRTLNNNGVLVLEDYKSKYINNLNRIRKTTNQPADFKRKICIFAGCNVFGVGHADDETISSRLQTILNEKASEQGFLVENHGNFNWGKFDMIWYSMNDVEFESGDVVVIVNNFNLAQDFYKEIPNVYCADISMRDDRDVEVFQDMWHYSEKGNEILAKNLFNFLKENDYLSETKPLDENIYKTEQTKIWGIPEFANSAYESKTKKEELLSDEHMGQLNEYLDKIKKVRPKTGAIVMNCNPFTLGHRYLIEYASKQVDHLYIFAVEEDRSFFPFSDRIKLIKEGTADLTNVTVLPSGNFIISTITFTDYFGKKELQDKKIDPSLDVSLFGEYIAPTLGITVRFAGEEPLDKVTLQYNESMKNILPKYGIDFVVIPRKESGGEVISASRVRKLLEENDFESIKKIVPETTYDYLIERFGD